jgi:hypothetical protein
MEAGLARLTKQPGKRMNFFCVYIKNCCADSCKKIACGGTFELSSRQLGIARCECLYGEISILVRQGRSRLFQARSRQPGQPYKCTMIFTIKITTQRDLAYRAVSLSGPARLPYKQALSTLTLFDSEFSSISGHLKPGGLVSAWQRINKFIFEIHNNHISTTEWLNLSRLSLQCKYLPRWTF